ncbi:hypothetical protein ACFQPA_10370 [Halomarina halobia]|uniref:Uncharacterized protein n=1 Tax=Halomarina halobia TaxID=3033386 RepID=A0ABD6AC74_9EURY|nr:hypothetical protein [Halomarina sp. PSR21]
MRRTVGLVLALCCVLSAGVSAVPLSASSASSSTPAAVATAPAALPVVTANNTTNYLDLNRTAVIGPNFDRADVDVGTALSADATAIGGEVRSKALDAAFRDAETRDARRALLLRYTRYVENETAELRARERRALSAFNAGERSTSRYLRTLAQLDAEAEQLDRLVGQLNVLRKRVRGAPVSERRLNAVRADLVALDGPVREHLVSVAAGRASPTRVSVETSDTGLVLSTITDRGRRPVYLREAYLGDVRRTSTGPDRYRGDDIMEIPGRVNELYPWASTRSYDGIHGMAEVYRVSLSHPHGYLTTFLDGQSDQVFREYQRKDLMFVPITRSTSNVTDELNLTVGQTHAGGPLLVRLENATGAPVNATVSVDGDPVGTTGSDGELWTLSSGRAVVGVRATAEEGTATVAVRDSRSTNGTG